MYCSGRSSFFSARRRAAVALSLRVDRAPFHRAHATRRDGRRAGRARGTPDQPRTTARHQQRPLGLHEGTPGFAAWWRDRAVRRKSISGASTTGPVSRRATSAPSHRADEPPGPQAPGKQARLVHTDRTDRSARGARMRCPGASVLCLSPPLVALLLTRWVIRSGQSHPPGLYTQLHQPGGGRRATAALARSGHSAATEEPAPSVTLPPTSVHVAVWCGDTPVLLRSLGDRCERNKRANRAWSARWPASPKGRIESEPRGPSQLRGVRGVSTHHTVPITNRHDSPWFESFRSHFALFWSFHTKFFEAKVRQYAYVTSREPRHFRRRTWRWFGWLKRTPQVPLTATGWSAVAFSMRDKSTR